MRISDVKYTSLSLGHGVNSFPTSLYFPCHYNRNALLLLSVYFYVTSCSSLYLPHSRLLFSILEDILLDEVFVKVALILLTLPSPPPLSSSHRLVHFLSVKYKRRLVTKLH
jgi:hypothetical protein